VGKTAISLIFGLALAFGGSVPKSVQRSGTGVTAQNDAAIESAIRAKLAKSKISADNFKVRVQGGVAYWEGATDVIQHKGAATRMAKAAGAKRVVNNIKISEAARAKARAKLESTRKRATIKRGDPRTEPRNDPRAAVVRH
jgi:uncharacterized protein YqgV (UPF0045/DUF77 family)